MSTTYYNGTILPIIVFTWTGDSVIQIQTTGTSYNKTIRNPDNCIYINDSNQNECVVENISIKSILYDIFMNRNHAWIPQEQETNRFYTYITNISNNSYAGTRTCGSDFKAYYCESNASFETYTGTLDKSSTEINLKYGDCIKNVQINDVIYNFDSFTFDTQYKGQQINDWNINSVGGWSLLLTPPLPPHDPPHDPNDFNQLGLISPLGINNSYRGTIQSRYFYTDLPTIFNSGLSDLLQFSNYLTTLPSSYLGATTILFSSAPCYPFYVTSTILYIFLYLFYGQIYSAGPFTSGNNLFLSDELSDLNSYRSTIQGLYDSVTAPFIANSAPNTVLTSSSAFASFCVYPQVYLNDDSTVTLQVSVPISLLQNSVNGVPFYQLDLLGQQQVLTTWLQNFFQEKNDDYFITFPNPNHKNITPAIYELQSYGQGPFSSVFQMVKQLAVNGNTFQIDMSVDSDKKTNFINANTYNAAYTTIPSTSSTPQPYFIYGIFYMKIKKWSVKLAVYCSKLLSISTIINKSSSVLSLSTIYEKIRQDTNGLILNDYYNYLTSTNDPNIYSDLLKNNCNSYFHADGTPITSISPYVLTTSGGVYNQSQLDCLCYNSLLAPPDQSGTSEAMCYDKNCYNSALSNPTPVLNAFGLTPTVCASANTCSTVNEFMTGTGNKRAQNPSVIDNLLYISNCGSLYTFNQSTRNNTILWIGIACTILATLFTFVISALSNYRPFIIIVLCCLVVTGFSILTYYGTIYLKGNWTCASFGKNQFSSDSSTSQPICVSVKNPSLELPDDCCEGQITTSCECAADSDCACSGGKSHCQSGQCEYDSDVGKTRPQLTVKTNRTRIFFIAFMFILAISLPLLLELVKRLANWNINGIVYGILVVIIMVIPFLLSLYYGIQQESKTEYTDSCAI